MKIVISGGSGQLGAILTRSFVAAGHDVTILTRANPELILSNDGARFVQWDAKTIGAWAEEIDGADVVINMAGRSVNCRYNNKNRKLILDSRVHSTRAIGTAIKNSKTPPTVWLQSSTATIYAHRYDAPNDENGIIGGNEPGVPETWNFSIEIAKAWEAAANEFADLPTRMVLMRTAMVMSADANGVFDVLMGLVKKRLGGTNGDGKQFVSWIHESDFFNAINHLIENDQLSGAVNIASPNPIPNRTFMNALRNAAGINFGLPAARWMLEIGAMLMKTETELILKSRRVVPGRLVEDGFEFAFPMWQAAAAEIFARWKRKNG